MSAPKKTWRPPPPPAILQWRLQHPLCRWAVQKEWGINAAVQIARLAGVTRQTAYTWLWGKNLPDIARMDKIERASEGLVTLRSWMDWYEAAPKNAIKNRRPAATRRRVARKAAV